jgi:hypothetical protein
MINNKLSQQEINKRTKMFEQGQGWCSKCKQFKPLEEFSFNKSDMFGHHHWCRSCHSKARKGNKKYQRKTRERARTLVKYYTDLAGGCCQKCGYNRSWFALDFHHINSNEKVFNVSQIARKQNGYNEDVATEIEKCILFCSNCHREYESGLWTAEFIKRDGLGWTIKPETIKENLLDNEYYEFMASYKYTQEKMSL